MVENTVVDDCLVLPHQQQEKDSGGENEAESLQLPILWIIRDLDTELNNFRGRKLII